MSYKNDKWSSLADRNASFCFSSLPLGSGVIKKRWFRIFVLHNAVFFEARTLALGLKSKCLIWEQEELKFIPFSRSLLIKIILASFRSMWQTLKMPFWLSLERSASRVWIDTRLSIISRFYNCSFRCHSFDTLAWSYLRFANNWIEDR